MKGTEARENRRWEGDDLELDCLIKELTCNPIEKIFYMEAALKCL